MQEQRIYSAIACNLRQFGYRDVTAEIVAGVHEAMRRSDATMPHGVVGMFAQGMLKEADEKKPLDA